jgi:hypothetical protein
MRAPGGHVTHDAFCRYRSRSDKKKNMAGLHDCTTPSKTLEISLGRRQVRERLPYRDAAPDGSADRAATQTKLGIACAQRATGDRPQNWKLAIAGFEDPPPGLRASAITGSLCRHRETLETTTEVKSLRDCAIPSKSLQIYCTTEKLRKRAQSGKGARK